MGRAPGTDPMLHVSAAVVRPPDESEARTRGGDGRRTVLGPGDGAVERRGILERECCRAREVTDSLAEVKVQESESIESALRRFKRKVQQEDIIKDIKKHSFYLKPGDKRRAKQALARKRTRKKQRRETE